jgi:heptosyltransferase-1
MNGAADSILVIRLGAMGDIIQALPAVAALKESFPKNRLLWLVAKKWNALLEGNPNIDEIVPFERGSAGGLRRSWGALRNIRPQIAIDFQGLVQSAAAGWVTRANIFIGLESALAREPLASLFYTQRVAARGPHRVERNLQLAAAAGAHGRITEAWIPAGRAEGRLPPGPFVLTSPFAGWVSKQWPLARYEELAALLEKRGLTLVANVPAEREQEITSSTRLQVHTSSLEGLIDATRRAAAVVGVDSGPLHLAAALGKPGVALYGPTDPAQTGPFQGGMTVLRDKSAETTYKRRSDIHPSMLKIGVEEVFDALLNAVNAHTAARQV